MKTKTLSRAFSTNFIFSSFKIIRHFEDKAIPNVHLKSCEKISLICNVLLFISKIMNIQLVEQIIKKGKKSDATWGVLINMYKHK